MKWTTSWASVASNASSGNGSASAEASATVTPGSFARAASTNDVDGSTADDRIGSEARDELLGQDARPAADVERSLTGRDPGEVRERDR